MKIVVRVLPPGRLDNARSYIFCDDEFGSGYMVFHQRWDFGLIQVYSKNTTIPMISAAAMNSSTAGNPRNVATTPVADCINAAPRKNARLIAESALPVFCASTSCRVMPNTKDWADIANPSITSRMV